MWNLCNKNKSSAILKSDCQSVSDFWNCQIEVKDCYLLITPVSDNSTVKVNQNISNIGFIVKSQKDIILNEQKIEEV